MKKIISIIAFLVGFAIQAWAYDFQSGNLLYSINSTAPPEVRLVGHVDGTAAQGELVIPETVTYDGITYSVTIIGKNAFRLCSGLIGNLVIPNSIKEIKAGAFSHCIGFTGDLVIPNSVTKMNIDTSPDNTVPGAFEECTGFHGHLVLSNALEIIGDAQGGGCFSGCVNFTGELVLPNTITYIGEMAFQGCKGFIGTLFVPESVTEINDNAFADCSGIENVVFPNNPFIKGSGLFASCINLTHIYIPEGWTTMGVRIFLNCTGLQSVLLPNGLKEINTSAFEHCINLTSINLPEGLERIEMSAFSNCINLEHINLPEGLKSIGTGAFSSCNSLKELHLPKNLVTIGGWAFRRSGLTGEMIIPDPVERIELYTFDSCAFIMKIVVGKSVNYVAEPAFRCTRLESIVIRATTPPELKRVANQLNLPLDVSITVPCGTLNAYQNAEGWCEFTNMHEGITDLFMVVSADETAGTVRVLKEATCEDKSVQVEALPREGCSFLYWEANSERVSEESVYIFEHEEDTELVAHFSGAGLEEEKALCSIYPNPTSSQVVILGENLQRAEVINMLGQQVLSVQCKGNEMQIDMAALPVGVYFVTVTDEEGRKCVRKVVKE